MVEGYYQANTRLDQYQQKAAVFAYIKRQASLVMDKGTGKTFVALDLIRLIKPRRVFIITQSKASVSNWIRHFDKYVISRHAEDKNGNTCIVTGQSYVIHIMTYSPYNYPVYRDLDLIILDECHSIKNRKSKRFKAVMRLIRKLPNIRRVIMTATPLSIDETDLWSQYVFLGVFERDWRSFSEKYCERYGFMKKKFRLQNKYKKWFMDQVKKVTFYQDNSVLNLKRHVRRIVKLDHYNPNRDIYDYCEKEFILEIEGVKYLTSNTLAKMAKLHQLCSGTVILEDGDIRYLKSEKIDWLINFLENQDEKVVIFCAYNAEIYRIASVLNKMNINYRTLYGLNEDKLGWQEFQDNPQVRVMVCQFRSGAQSIDLQSSRLIIYFSLTFHYIDYDQSLGRIRRRGQDRSTKSIFLVMNNTIDQIIFNNLQRKHRLANGVFKQLQNKTI